jgi:NADH-quinone oxidoreductase subunit L
MEGPTPVSALMHAATLVTAGCILLIKFNFIIQQYLYILLISSLLTAIYCSLRAVVEFDFKKIVALSTAAQMSVVFLVIALNRPKLAVTYLTVHALFKSLLFWVIGFINHQN